MSDIRDKSLAEKGVARIEWALKEMPVLRGLSENISNTKPLSGLRISGCLHITTETANLARTLKSAGADLVLCAVIPSVPRMMLPPPWCQNTGSRCMLFAVKIPRLTTSISSLPLITDRS